MPRFVRSLASILLATAADATCPIEDDGVKRVILWTAPRSGSSVFARSMMQRNDTHVYFERLYDAHYLGPERRSTNYGDTADGVDPPTRTYKAVLEDLLGDSEDNKKLFFAKEMAYYYVHPEATSPEELEWHDLMDCFQHSFLLRAPRKQVPSFVKVTLAEAELQRQAKEDAVKTAEFADWVPAPEGLDLDELGVRQLHLLYQAVENRTGVAPVVVDIDDVFSKPEETLTAFCDGIGMDFDESMLTWEKGWRPEFRFWDDGTEWMRDVLASDGFKKQGSTERRKASGKAAPSLCPTWYSAMEDAEVLYNQMYDKRITM